MSHFLPNQTNRAPHHKCFAYITHVIHRNLTVQRVVLQDIYTPHVQKGRWMANECYMGSLMENLQRGKQVESKIKQLSMRWSLNLVDMTWSKEQLAVRNTINAQWRNWDPFTLIARVSHMASALNWFVQGVVQAPSLFSTCLRTAYYFVVHQECHYCYVVKWWMRKPGVQVVTIKH